MANSFQSSETEVDADGEDDQLGKRKRGKQGLGRVARIDKQRQQPTRKPVRDGARISVFWTEEPSAGWFQATVLKSKRRGELMRWETQVRYDDVDDPAAPGGTWEEYEAWHYLDGGEGSVRWRVYGDSSDEELDEVCGRT